MKNRNIKTNNHGFSVNELLHLKNERLEAPPQLDYQILDRAFKKYRDKTALDLNMEIVSEIEKCLQMQFILVKTKGNVCFIDHNDELRD